MSVNDPHDETPARIRLEFDREAGSLRLIDQKTGGSLALDRRGIRAFLVHLVESLRYIPSLPNETPLMSIHRPAIDVLRDDLGNRMLSIQPADLPAIEVKLSKEDAQALALALGV